MIILALLIGSCTGEPPPRLVDEFQVRHPDAPVALPVLDVPVVSIGINNHSGEAGPATRVKFSYPNSDLNSAYVCVERRGLDHSKCNTPEDWNVEELDNVGGLTVYLMVSPNSELADRALEDELRISDWRVVVQ